MENNQQMFRSFQRDEITAARIYGRLAIIIKDEHNSGILRRIAA